MYSAGGWNGVDVFLVCIIPQSYIYIYIYIYIYKMNKEVVGISRCCPKRANISGVGKIINYCEDIYIIMVYCISSIRPRAPIRPRPRLDRTQLRYLSRIVRAVK